MEDNKYFTVEEMQEDMQRFGVYDYIVFVVMLVLCALVGVYYAFFSKKKDSEQGDEDEYLLGGRNMKIVPVSFSLVASFISGISLLGTPTELYVYGTEYCFVFIGMILMGFTAGTVYLPVFHNLRLSSTYEYLERRFSKKVRLYGSVLFTISIIFWLPIVIYVPALAFNQVTGVNVHIVTPCVCLVCIFYTCVGGMKAVVWTDVIQTWVMVGAMLIVIIKGTLDVGGLGVVWQRCWDSGRIEVPSFDVDPTIRNSFWSLSVGGWLFFLQIGATSQNFTQRFLSLPSIRHLMWALGIFICGLIFILSMCMYSGLLIYATYFDCDPLTTKLAKAKDQLLPLLVMRVLGDYPGMPGLFVAGVFSAALSSLSTGLNSMSAVVLEDFCKPFYGKMRRKTKNFIMKGVVVLFGVICVGLVFVVEKLGTVLQLSISLSSVTNGSSLGIFTCGILLPWVNSAGVLIGGVTGMIVSSIIIIGAQKSIATGALKFATKPTSIAGCDYAYNITSILNATTTASSMVTEAESYVFPLYKISYLWYTSTGAIVTVIAAIIASYLIGFNDTSKIDPVCVSPWVRKYLNNKNQDMRVKEEELIEMIKKNELTIKRNLQDD